MPKDVLIDVPRGERAADRAALKLGWAEAFGSPPPPKLSMAFMERAVAYARQCREQGGLSATSERQLRAIAGGRDPAAGRAVAAGAQLVREWNGRTYRVEVVEGGYRFDGRSWASLTAIARRITGTHWSGPRFFGLTGKRGR